MTTAGLIRLTEGTRPAAAVAAGSVGLWAGADERVYATRGDGVDCPMDGRLIPLTLAAATSLSASHHARLLTCTGTWALTVPAASAALSGLSCRVSNVGVGTITLAGGAAASIVAGKSLDLSCDGSQWIISGRDGVDGGLALGKHTLWIPVSAMTGVMTSPAEYALAETTTNKITYPYLRFDTATVEYAQFAIAMPKSWDRGTVTFQVLWTAASGSGGVAWSLQGVAIGDDDALDAAFGTAITVTDTLIAAGDLHLTAESGAVTIAGSPAVGDLIVFRLARQVANPADTLGVDGEALGIRVFATLDAGNDA